MSGEPWFEVGEMVYLKRNNVDDVGEVKGVGITCDETGECVYYVDWVSPMPFSAGDIGDERKSYYWASELGSLRQLSVGNRIYYREGGKEDTGTVQEVWVLPSRERVYKVAFDKGNDPPDWYEAAQLVLVK